MLDTFCDYFDRVFGRYGYIHSAWYWLKCALWHRHNVLHIRTLPCTWTDRDTRLEHAVFQILTDFIEQECSPGWVDWDADEQHRTVMAEMLDHVKWWKEVGKDFDEFAHAGPKPVWTDWFPDDEIGESGYRTMRDPSPEEHAYFGRVREIEEAHRAEMTRRLIRVIELRGYYWT